MAAVLSGYTGEVVTIGFDFASVPLNGKQLVKNNENGDLVAYLIDENGDHRPEGIAQGPVLDDTTVTVQIEPIPTDVFIDVFVPADDGDVYTGRRYLVWSD